MKKILASVAVALVLSSSAVLAEQSGIFLGAGFKALGIKTAEQNVLLVDYKYKFEYELLRGISISSRQK